MNQVQVNTLRQQLGLMHKVLEDTIAGLTDSQAHWQPAGQAHSIAANYAHVVVQEDVIINVLLKRRKPFFAIEFAGQTSLSEIPPLPDTQLVNWHAWGEKLTLDLKAINSYSQAVYDNTDAYLADIDDTELSNTIDTVFLGEMTKFELINLALLANCGWHTGEISAIKGLQSLTGYPF